MEAVSLPKEKTYLYTLFLIGLVLIVFVVVSVWTVIKNKNIYLETSIAKSKAQAQLLGENTSSLFYSADLALLSIVSMLESYDEKYTLIPETTVQAIKKQTVFLPQISNVVLLDHKKEIIYARKKIDSFDLISFEDHRDRWLEFSINTVPFNKKKQF